MIKKPVILWKLGLFTLSHWSGRLTRFVFDANLRLEKLFLPQVSPKNYVRNRRKDDFSLEQNYRIKR